MEEKACIKCGEVKKETDFYWRNGDHKERMNTCKECFLKYQHEYRNANGQRGKQIDAEKERLRKMSPLDRCVYAAKKMGVSYADYMARDWINLRGRANG